MTKMFDGDDLSALQRGQPPVKTAAHISSNNSSFLMTRMVDGDDLSALQRGQPPVKTAAHISSNNSGTARDGERSSINANRRSNIGFPTSHNQGRASLLTSLKWGSDAQIFRLWQKFGQKAIKSLLQSCVVLKASSSKVVAQSTERYQYFGKK